MTTGYISNFDYAPISSIFKEICTCFLYNTSKEGKATIVCNNCEGYFKKIINPSKLNIVDCPYCKDKIRILNIEDF